MTTDITELLAEVDAHLAKHKVEGVGEHHSIMRRLAKELRQRLPEEELREGEAKTSLADRASSPRPAQAEGLLPCPFCGIRMIRRGLDQPHWQQWWEHEDRDTSICPLKNQTISDTSKVYKAAWNTRASLPEDGKLDAAARKAAEKIAEYDADDNRTCGSLRCEWYCEHWKNDVAAIITAELRGEKEG